LNPNVVDTVPFIMEEWSTLNHDELEPLRRCAVVQSGGSPLSLVVASKLLEAGLPLRQFYGQTEAPGIQMGTVPGASAEEMAIMIPEFKGSMAVLEGGGEEGQLLIQDIENSALGVLANGKLVAGTCSMQAGGHKTGDVFRWRTTASGRKGLEHCMRTDDILLLSTGEMFNPIPMEKSISEFVKVKGVEDLRGSQVAVLGKNRPSPILVVELPKDHRNDIETCLAKLQPGIDAANAAEVEYARIRPGYTLILSPSSKVLLQKTAKGNFIRGKSEQMLAESLDKVEADAQVAEEERLAALIAEGGEASSLGLDSLGARLVGDSDDAKIFQICDNMKAFTICSVLTFHFYFVSLIGEAPKASFAALKFLGYVTATRGATNSKPSADPLHHPWSIIASYCHQVEFSPSMWAFFIAFGVVDGMQDGKGRVLHFFGHRTCAVVLIVILWKCCWTFVVAMDLVSLQIDGYNAAGKLKANWFFYAMFAYRASVRLMQALQIPPWIQVGFALLLNVPRCWDAYYTTHVTVDFWPARLLADSTGALVPCLWNSFMVQGQSQNVGLGVCLWTDDSEIKLWASYYDLYAVAHVFAYYYGEGIFKWFLKRCNTMLGACQSHQRFGSNWTLYIQVFLVAASFWMEIGMYSVMDWVNWETVSTATCFGATVLLYQLVLLVKLIAAVASPFHAKRVGKSALGIYVLHRCFPFLFFHWVVDLSNYLYESQGEHALVTVAQLVLLVGWPYVLTYALGPTMQWLCLQPLRYLTDGKAD